MVVSSQIVGRPVVVVPVVDVLTFFLFTSLTGV